ncbi:N-formylglutamate amidohydrolase [Brevundimonas sp. BH3]|uniref:N-formylglutamate amidohydrolase n=1 Tax=Brevundimonas sp. BH3 TaxID=3133089 RepID=UPI00324AC10E
MAELEYGRKHYVPMTCNADIYENLATDPLWTLKFGASPLIGTAIHDGHAISPHLVNQIALDAAGRLREEDPFTAHFIADMPTQIVVHRSRFEFDLNRSPESAVYLDPEQAWGLEVWHEKPDQSAISDLLRQHASYYRLLHHVLTQAEIQFGKFIVLDIHSYNHRRDGPESPPTDQNRAPDINIGTFSMDRERWAHVIEPFIASLRASLINGRHIDVRENIAFQGRGEQTRFIHEHFPSSGCAIAVEMKKIFMDEWTGKPDHSAIAELRAAITASLPVLKAALEGVA